MAERAVQAAEAEALAEEHGVMYAECSAVDNRGVDEAVAAAVRAIRKAQGPARPAGPARASAQHRHATAERRPQSDGRPPWCMVM